MTSIKLGMPYLIWGEVRIIVNFDGNYMQYKSLDGRLEGYLCSHGPIDTSEFKFLGETRIERIIYGVE